MEPTFYGLLTLIGILLLLWVGSEAGVIIRKIRDGKVRYTGKHRNGDKRDEYTSKLQIFDEIHEDVMRERQS